MDSAGGLPTSTSAPFSTFNSESEAVSIDSSGSSGSATGVNADTATLLSRQPWIQTADPFASNTNNVPTARTSSEVNARRKAKAASNAMAMKVSASMDAAEGANKENDNDVEWIVDAFSADAPESSDAVVRGMSSSGRSVNRRRQQQQQPVTQQLDVQESRILKTRLDELRKANGLYVSDPLDEAVEKKLIDHFR